MKRKTSGVTLIELIIAMSIMALVFLILIQTFTPLKNALVADKVGLENYKQLLFATLFLDSLSRMSDEIMIEDKKISFRKGVDTTVCEIKEREFGCWFRNNPNRYISIINLARIKSEAISISKDESGIPIQIKLNGYQIQFGLFPQVFLL